MPANLRREAQRPVCVAYCEAILALPEMREWTKAALAEPEAIDELEVGF